MKKNTTLLFITLFLVLSVFVVTSCRDAVKEPPPTGPSSYATLLGLSANPNVLFAGLDTRQVSTITATLKKYDGTPLSGETIYFEIVDSQGSKVNIGFFDPLYTQSMVTDGSGTAEVLYFGPLYGEVARNSYICIRATVAGTGPEFIQTITWIYIVVP